MAKPYRPHSLEQRGTRMADLAQALNLPDGDGFYQDLLAAHEGLSERESHAFNARLVLVLANHIGDQQVLKRALELAGRAARKTGV